jgi:hypothetical protein
VPIESGGGGEETESESGLEGDDTKFPDRAGVEKPGSSAVDEEANRQLGKLTSSTYSHKTHIDEGAGVFDYDCSGFVGYTLLNVKPDAFEALRKATVQRPLAKHFVDFIVAIGPNTKNGRWRRIARAEDLAPGDIVAWLKPSDVVSKNTGHVMIVNAPIVREFGGVAVPIVDSTSMRHGRQDSRWSSHATGLGIGEIVLVTDAHGAPIGYRWSRGKKSKDHSTIIALARVE